MKIFSTSDIKTIEKTTIEKEPITPINLMERASSAIACEIISRWLLNKRIVVFAGPGNNGGDALAVARMLIEQGYTVEIFLFNIGGGKLSKECTQNKERLFALGEIDFTEIINEFNPPYLSKDDLVIDGLFGSGLREPLKGGFTSLVRYINESGAFIISIDMPSGLFGEWNSENIRNNIVNANLTLSLQFSRLSFFFAENAEFVGEWKVLDIELSQDAIKNTPSNFYLVEKSDVKKVLRKRKDFANKYDFGSLMLVAGSYGMMGAAIISARAAARSGCGIVNVHAPRCGMMPIQSSIPEAIYDADKHDIIVTDIDLKHNYSAIAIGPGLGTNPYTVAALEKFLTSSQSPCILDADALNCIAQKPALLNNLPIMSIITPHAKEFDRLFGDFYTDEMRVKKALEVSRYYNIIIVLKGHHTMTIRPDGKIYINNSGNSGMATAGSGDALTGIIGSLVAQGYKPEVSAVVGAYIHGYAGDMAQRKNGNFGMIASDIVDNIGLAIKEIMQ
ncbi:MAG: NAD(P)H-hydrate dehydratase [Muribaculaceae bacterium]|nr:NAD(P)H-hydrate dehydratase [Muribaculaceae bacterium]